MKKLMGIVSASAAVLLFAAAGAAHAEDVAVSYNLGVTSDYVFRGVSQTDEGPAIQGGIDLTAGTFYAGTWASNVDFGDSTSAEVDLYAGFKPEYAGFSFDVGVVGYLYVNQPGGADWDYIEGKVAASHPVGQGGSIGAAVYYSPEYTGNTGEAIYAELNGSAKLSDKFSLSGAVGHQSIDLAGDYNTWNLGLGYALTDHVGLDLRYHDTDEHGFGDIYDSRVVLSLKGTF